MAAAALLAGRGSPSASPSPSSQQPLASSTRSVPAPAPEATPRRRGPELAREPLARSGVRRAIVSSSSGDPVVRAVIELALAEGLWLQIHTDAPGIEDGAQSR